MSKKDVDFSAQPPRRAALDAIVQPTAAPAPAPEVEEKKVQVVLTMTEDERRQFKTKTAIDGTSIQAVLYDAYKRYMAGNRLKGG